jgi:hypothetical protein
LEPIDKQKNCTVLIKIVNRESSAQKVAAERDWGIRKALNLISCKPNISKEIKEQVARNRIARDHFVCKIH